MIVLVLLLKASGLYNGGHRKFMKSCPKNSKNEQHLNIYNNAKIMMKLINNDLFEFRSIINILFLIYPNI